MCPRPNTADDHFLDGQTMEIECNVNSGDEGISKETMTGLDEDQIDYLQNTIDPGSTQNGGIEFEPIVGKPCEPWSSLYQQSTGE